VIPFDEDPKTTPHRVSLKSRFAIEFDDPPFDLVTAASASFDRVEFGPSRDGGRVGIGPGTDMRAIGFEEVDRVEGSRVL
jgi:hypothetical protein